MSPMSINTDRQLTKGDQMKANRFQRGSGCYTCAVCKKLTRSTGRGDNEHVGLCAYCYDKAGDENAVSDGHMTQAEFDAKYPPQDAQH